MERNQPGHIHQACATLWTDTVQQYQTTDRHLSDFLGNTFIGHHYLFLCFARLQGRFQRKPAIQTGICADWSSVYASRTSL